MSLLPSSPEVSVEDDPRVVGLDSEEADDLMQALSSDTARQMLSALHEEPLPPSRLANQVDTTLQNAQYHLERLSEAGAIEVVGTAYSEKGREMDVYAPADKPLVIFAGRDEQASGIRAALRRLVGGLAALLFGAIAIQEVFGRGVRRLAAPLFGGTSGAGGGGDAGGGAGADGDAAATATPTETRATTPTETPVETRTGTPAPETSGGGDDVGIFGEESTATATPQPTAAEPATDTPAPEATEAVADGAAGATPTSTPVADTATEAARMTAETGGADPALGLPPGLVFFLGGAVVLGVALVLTYR
ncbi:ArsR family transcriptional regulator [Haloglomus irregulare]|jgi:DNA-binding transcriptional ArsR family regulator|uniref:ArsR family transcriptional regulator n=1 Tax=Haloglomus irregulare TaxID=2234134 RepID=A0A554NEV3_9EURY|nr:winged helix-turn-helix domain-containing protein [Haloglomus irregulare]TSD15923.1 ArsR family transcriptional regulator [Haloglomus irregulare]